MTAIPVNRITMEELAHWYVLRDQLAQIRLEESLLRKKIVAFYFPSPREGVNKVTLPDGYLLEATCGYDRAVDIPTFEAIRESVKQDGFLFNPDALVRFKPDLVTKEYRMLTDDERAYFDHCLIVKPSSPTLRITAPKKKA